MTDFDNTPSFFEENKKLVKDYLETRLEIYRLHVIRILAKSGGYLVWIIISLFLLFLLFIFLGLTTGFWLSNLMGSYVKGFGLTTLIILLIITILALLRKTLFVNPIIRGIIKKTGSDEPIQDDDTEL